MRQRNNKVIVWVQIVFEQESQEHFSMITASQYYKMIF